MGGLGPSGLVAPIQYQGRMMPQIGSSLFVVWQAGMDIVIGISLRPHKEMFRS
jgi:hypothetical protein